METATVINDGDRQTVRLPIGYRLSTPTVHVRQQGDAIVLEPMKPQAWPPGFFDEIHISDPAFERPDQGALPAVKEL
jgi:virulence-associated protein VagC